MMRKLIFVLACLVALAAGAWLSSWVQQRNASPDIQGMVLSEPRAFESFRMTDDAGAAFTEADFQGHWSLLYFGFTYCPDICPMTLAVFSQLKNMLSDTGRANTRFYLVSVDPARDTPERLHDYVRFFDPEFRGLTGPVRELDKLTAAAGALYVIPGDTDREDYLVDHSSTVTLVNPEGKVHAVFTAPHTAEQLARDLTQVVARW